jgi:biopolymer transport protein ExbD
MSAGPVEGGSDVELNLAPIIDCFTVLITYLLVTASFLSLAALDVGVSASGAGTPPPAKVDNTPPPMVMSLEAMANGDVKVNVRGGVSGREYPYVITNLGGQRDPDRLLAKLEEIKKKWPTISDASISAEPAVIYKDLVQVIKKVQEAMPKVLISSS